MPTLDANNPLRPNSSNTVDFLGSLSFAGYAITAGNQNDDQLLVQFILPDDPWPPLEPSPISDPFFPGPEPEPWPDAPFQRNINDRFFDARSTWFAQFYFSPVEQPDPESGTLVVRIRQGLALLNAWIEKAGATNDLVIHFGDQHGSVTLLDFLSPIFKGSPITQIRLEIEEGSNFRVVTQSTVEFLTEHLAQTSLADLIARFADSLTSGAGSQDLLLALLSRAKQDFAAGALHPDQFDTHIIGTYFSGSTEYIKHSQFYDSFMARLKNGSFTEDDVQVYTTLRLLRSDQPLPQFSPFGMSVSPFDMPLILDANHNAVSPSNPNTDPADLNRLTKAAYFAGYQASVEAAPTLDTVALDNLYARAPNPMVASPLVDLTLKALRIDQVTQTAVHTLFEQGKAVIDGANVSLYWVPPSELPAGANGALVSDAQGRKLLLVSQMLTAPWRNVVVAEELASLLAQRYETQRHSELPGDEGRYVLTRVVRDIVQEVRHQGPRASEWQAAFDALPRSWTTLSDTDLNQLVVRASLSNDKHAVKTDGKDYTYELSSFGDWTAPVAGAIAGVVTGAALGTAGLFVAGPAGAALGAKAGLETGLLVAGLSALGGGAIGGVAGATYASALESQSVQQDVEHHLNPAAPTPANDALEQTFRQAAYVAPTDVNEVLGLARAGLSYAQIMAMPGVDKVALARDSALLPQYGYDNPYFSNLDNAFGFESLGSVVSVTQRQLIEKRIQATIPFEDQIDVAHELFAYGNARGMLGHLLKDADAQGIDLALGLYQNLRFAYTHTATKDIFKAIDPLAWGGESGFWAVNEKTKSSGEDISAKFATTGDYQKAQGTLADMAFGELTSLLEKPDMLRMLSPNKIAELLRYLTHTTLMSQAADLEMLRLAHALDTQPSGELVGEVISLLLGSAAGGIKTIEERGFRILAAQTQELAEHGAVSPEWSFISDQVKQVTQGFNQDLLQPLTEQGKVIGPAHEAGFGEFGPVALLQGAKWEDMLFSSAPLARGWVLDPNLVTYINTQHPFLKDPSDPTNSNTGVFNAQHWQQLLRDGTATDNSGKFIVSLRLVDPQTMGGLPGQVAARVGADGRHHIEVLISRDLSPADRDGVLFEELNNVDEYIYSSRHETDPINHPLIDTVTVGDYGGRALVSYEMYLRNTYDKGLPMFADLSDPSLGYALKVETINDDRFVDSVVLHDGVPETVTLYANTNSSVQHPNASAFVAVRPAFYLSTHTGYATTASMGEVSNHFKSYVDLSRVRFQFSMDPTAKFNQGGEPAPGKHRPVSDSWTSFDITLENLSSLQLNTGAYLPNIPILLPMLWDLTTWSTDLSGRPSDGAQFSKSPSFTYQSGLATGATDRPSVANVDNRSEALQSQIDILQAKKTRATTDLEKNELDVKLTQANLEMTQLNNYKHQLIDLADNHSGHLNYSAGARLGGYFFGLHDITRPVDTGIDVLDNNALGTELSGGLGAASAGLARAAGLGFHEASGTAAVVAFGIRTASQISATTSSEILFNQDLALFDNNGIHRPEVLRKFGLGIGPDGQPNSQLEKYLSLVEAGQSAGLTPLSRSWLLGFAAQGFAGLQVKKDIAVMKAPDRLLAGDVELDSRESVNRLNNHEIDFAQVEINFRNQNPSAQINPPPGPGGSNHNFVYDPHHFEFNIGFFVSAGERFDVTTAGTRVVSGSGLEVPIWQQGVMGI